MRDLDSNSLLVYHSMSLVDIMKSESESDHLLIFSHLIIILELILSDESLIKNNLFLNEIKVFTLEYLKDPFNEWLNDNFEESEADLEYFERKKLFSQFYSYWMDDDEVFMKSGYYDIYALSRFKLREILKITGVLKPKYVRFAELNRQSIFYV